MKRYREAGELDSMKTMASCLMLLSPGEVFDTVSHSPTRVFECKTCNRQFMSFQALGGHRASHKKPRLTGKNADSDGGSMGPPVKPKTHECSICGLEFTVGQALGGHMRRHRAAMHDNNTTLPLLPATPVLKKSSSKRVFCLDLNLPPTESVLDLYRLGKVAPLVHCFI